MEFITNLIFPINTDKLYHSYIGTVDKIVRNNKITFVYFKSNPNTAFYIHNPLYENILDGDKILIHYQEIVNELFTSFEVKHVHTITNDYVESMTVYCLFCGRSLLYSKFKQCQGTIVKHYSWDDMLLEDVYTHDGCSEFFCNNRDDSLWTPCSRKEYTCCHCNTTRVIHPSSLPVKKEYRCF